jgi:hypothetical protein
MGTISEWKIQEVNNYKLTIVASMFDMPTFDVTSVFVNVVGVLKDILKLDYGLVHNLVHIFRCEWMKQEDNRGNLTYVKDDVEFLTVNF